MPSDWEMSDIINCFKGKGDAVERGNFRGLKLLDLMKVLSPLLFIIVLEALSREFRTGLPSELLYADDLVLMANSIEELEILFERWKSGMEQKGLRVNSGKTKVIIWKHKRNPQNKTGKFPCSVCLKGVGRNSIFCPACKCWVHAKCSGLKGQLAKATNFVCSQCSSACSSR